MNLQGVGAIAAFITIMALPWAFIGPFSSVFVDWLPKKKVMLFCIFMMEARGLT
ncbi:putative MFS family arabinose efflux permease [Bacillus sp. V2I10]|nr:putative MFS family arabinose efflux permease [Bacillus sp. V2I10]